MKASETIRSVIRFIMDKGISYDKAKNTEWIVNRFIYYMIITLSKGANVKINDDQMIFELVHMPVRKLKPFEKKVYILSYRVSNRMFMVRIRMLSKNKGQFLLNLSENHKKVIQESINSDLVYQMVRQ